MKFFTSTVLALAATATSFAVADMDAKERKLDGHLINPALDYLEDVICFEPESMSLVLGDDDDDSGTSKRKLYKDEEENLKRMRKLQKGTKGGDDDDDDDDDDSGRPGGRPGPVPPFLLFPPNLDGFISEFVIIDLDQTEDINAQIDGRMLGSKGPDEDVRAGRIFPACDALAASEYGCRGGRCSRELGTGGTPPVVDAIGELYVNIVEDYNVGSIASAEVLSANATGRTLFEGDDVPVSYFGNLALNAGVAGVTPSIVSFSGFNTADVQQYAANVRLACRQRLLLPELDLDTTTPGPGGPRRNPVFDGFAYPYWFTGGTPTGFQHGFLLKIANDVLGGDLFYIFMTNDYSDLSGVDPEVYAYLAALQSGAESCFPAFGKKGGGMGAKGAKGGKRG